MAAATPSLRARVGKWIAGQERASSPPIEFEPNYAHQFGPATANQAPHDVLLRESLGIVDTATRAIANRLSSLEPLVKRTTLDVKGTTIDETIDDHPLKRLLDRPHPNLSRRQLLRLTGQYIVTVGEAYWLKVGNRMGMPVELHSMPPGKVRPLVRQGVVEGYEVTDGDGRIDELPADVVVRFFFPDPESPWLSEGYMGPSAVTSDSRKFAGEHLRRRYQFDATPPSVLEAGEAASAFSPEESARFANLWRQKYSSRKGGNAGTPAMLPLGYKLVQMAMQSGADMTPLLEHWRDDLLMAFGVPRSILGQVVSGDRSSAETNQFVFDLHTILPISQMIEDAITLQLAGDFETEVFVQFDKFVASDKRFELERETAYLTHKVRSINGVLEANGEDPVEWGEMPVGKLGEVPYTGEAMDFGVPDEEPDPDMDLDEDMPLEDDDERTRSHDQWMRHLWERQNHDEKKYIPSFFSALAQLLTMQKRETLKRLHDRFPSTARIDADEIFTVAEWRDLFERRLTPLRESAYQAVLGATLSDFGITDFDFTSSARAALKADGARLVSWTLRTTRKDLVRALDASIAEGEGVEQAATRIRKVFGVRRKQALTTARTEILKASSRATLDGFETAGVKRMRWHTSMDDAVRDTHVPMEGVTVDVGQPFELATVTGGREFAAAPRQGYQGAGLSAGNTINCRCFLVPVTEGA